MSIAIAESTDAKVASKNIQNEIGSLVDRLRSQIEQVEEPRFQALLETSAEVLLGLRTAFRDYNEKPERAWGTR